MEICAMHSSGHLMPCTYPDDDSSQNLAQLFSMHAGLTRLSIMVGTTCGDAERLD